MRIKGIHGLIIVLMIVTLILGACEKKGVKLETVEEITTVAPTTVAATTEVVTENASEEKIISKKVELTPMDTNSIVAQYGQLQVIGNQLSNAAGEPIQLKGLSSYGLQYSGSLVNKDVITFLKDDWKIQLYRGAMYTAENGYLTSKYSQTKMEEAIAACVELGLYVIIDWHILSDGNPLTNVEESKLFFADMAEKYSDYPNIIYEICNEPNGKDVTWDEVIKPYAEQVIPVIRQYDPDSIIIVGTSTWSQDVDIAANNPLDFENLLYTCHFYAGSHGAANRAKVQTALDKGIAIFVTEWGTTTSSGSGGVYIKETKEWLAFLDENKISNANWGITSHYEDAAILVPKSPTNGQWTEANYTESGKFIRSYLRGEME